MGDECPSSPESHGREVQMQILVLVGVVLMSLFAAVGTASLVIGLVLRFMSKVR